MGLGAFPPVYTGEDLNIIRTNPYPWPSKIQEILESKPDKRNILWVFDGQGKNGKSDFAKLQVLRQKALLLSWDGARDIFYARKMEPHKSTILFDFTRSIPKYVDIHELFSAIESLKNGLLFSSKYESGQLVTPSPHIIIFSNWLPPNPRQLSRDRWKIVRIGNTSKDLIEMDAKQCNDFILDFKYFEIELKNWLKEKKQDDDEESELIKLLDDDKNSFYKGLFVEDEVDDNTNYIVSNWLLEDYGD